MSAAERLNHVFDADVALRRAEAQFLEAPRQAAAEALQAAIARNLEETSEDAVARLALMAELVPRVLQDAPSVDALIAILGHESAIARAVAGRALLGIGYERYVELARGVERALDAKNASPAMEELPGIVAEIGEPSALKLLGRFLAHPNKEIVAAAMEACVDLGDPAAIPLLEKFSGDERVVSIEDFEDEMSIRLGELAEECMAELDADGE